MRWVVGFVGWVLLLGSLALVAARFATVANAPVAEAAAFATYSLIGFLLALVLLLPLAARRTRVRPWLFAGATVALLGVGYQLWLLAPLYAGDSQPLSRDLTVMTANLRFGQADANTVVRDATDRGVDVLALEEVTPQERARLQAAGLDQLLPNVAGDPQAGVTGTMVFSRFPLTPGDPLDLGNGGLAVTVGAPRPFTLLAVHTATPNDAPRVWARDLRTLRTRVRFTPGPVIVAGDFNATTDHALFRQILAGRLADSPAQANAGWLTTWPTSERRAWYRPVVAIDHVLVSPRFTATRVRTLDLPGSDHRGLVVDLAVHR